MEFKRVAEFEKVSFEEFKSKWGMYFGYDRIEEVYESIKLPMRGTSGSAGYDFSIPGTEDRVFYIHSGESIIIPTGIRCKIAEGWVLQIVPRSSIGIKREIFLSNTIGVIDSDYYMNPDNEGHIMIGLGHRKDITNILFGGMRIAQGIFLPYGITVDDSVTAERIGGVGSTGR